MVFCTYCGNEFQRHEHLERHLLTHTEAKPFSCPTCHTSFNRKDLLQRHVQTIHASGHSVFPVAEPLTTSAIACERCAKAKAKCDRESPCSRCLRRGEECIPRADRRPAAADLRRLKRKREAEADTQFHQPLLFASTSASSATPDSGSLHIGASTSADYPPQYGDCTTPPATSQPTTYPLYPSSSATAAPTTSVSVRSASVRDEYDSPMHFDFSTLNDLDFSLAFDLPLDFEDPAIKALYDWPELSMMPDDLLGTSAPQLFSAQPQTAQLQSAPSPSAPTYADLQRLFNINEESWPGFCCNPMPTTDLPEKANRCHLANLQAAFRAFAGNEKAVLNLDSGHADDIGGEVLGPRVEPMSAGARTVLEKAIQSTILAVTSGSRRTGKMALNGDLDPSAASVEPPQLPSARVLDYFLRVFAREREPFYELNRGQDLHLLQFLDEGGEAFARIALMLMIAHGAMATPTIASIQFAQGLTEACRILSSDPSTDQGRWGDLGVLFAAFLFLNLAAWSGDVWHMNFLLRETMFTKMLRKAKVLDATSVQLDPVDGSLRIEDAFAQWRASEGRSRLLYAWVILDQETSLFFNAAPKIPVADLTLTMPDVGTLWKATTADEWMRSYVNVYGLFGRHTNRPLSLHDFFKKFSSKTAMDVSIVPSAKHMQILLHGIQTQAAHLFTYFEILFADGEEVADQATEDAAFLLLQQIRTVIGRWTVLSERVKTPDATSILLMVRNRVLSHLQMLSTYMPFAHVEKLARGGTARNTFREAYFLTHKTANPYEIHFYAGQALRLCKSLAQAHRPAWFPAAVYRIIFTLWSSAMANIGWTRPNVSLDVVVIDQVLPEEELMVRYVKTGQAVPMLSRRDGLVPADSPRHIIEYGVELLAGQLIPAPLQAGISRKLERLMERWAHHL